MNKLILITGFLLLAGGCGQQVSRSSGPRILGTLPSVDPLFMESEYKNCTLSNFEKPQLEIPLQLFLQGSATQENKNFHGLFDGIYLRDPEQKSISRTIFGEQINMLKVDNGAVSNRYLVSKKNGSDVTICPDQVYKTNSIESAALNAAYYIHLVFKKVMPLLPEHEIKPITLKVGSIWKYEIQQMAPGGMFIGTSYETDNALYEAASHTITFLPHSRSKKAYLYPMNFWSIPMVAAHEYGHHIFHTLSPQTDSSLHLSGCFHPIVEINKPDANIKNMDVEHSLNEGFADLIAFYALPANERGVQGINDLDKDRDVSSAQFSGLKAEKTYNEHVLRGFFNSSSAPIDHLRYRSPHLFGAVFAHRVDFFLSSLDATEDQRLEIVLDWAREFGQRKPGMSGLDPRAFLEASLAMMVESGIKRMNKTLDAKVCKEVTRFYPAFNSSFAECQQ